MPARGVLRPLLLVLLAITRSFVSPPFHLTLLSSFFLKHAFRPPPSALPYQPILAVPSSHLPPPGPLPFLSFPSSPSVLRSSLSLPPSPLPHPPIPALPSFPSIPLPFLSSPSSMPVLRPAQAQDESLSQPQLPQPRLSLPSLLFPFPPNPPGPPIPSSPRPFQSSGQHKPKTSLSSQLQLPKLPLPPSLSFPDPSLAFLPSSLSVLLTAQAQQESLTQSQLLQQRVQDVFGAGAAGNSAEAGASGPGEVTLENDEMLLGRVSEMERELRKQLAEQERAGGQLTGLPQSTVLHLNIGALYSPHLDSLNCSNAPTCPDFSGRCSVNPEISACFNPGLEDDGKQWLRAPENCPKVKNVVENGAEGFDVRCSHESDFAWHKWMVFQTFLLRGVYVSAQGQVFNESTHFARKGCGHFSEFSYPQSTPVRHMHRALSLVYPQATGFYHGLIEWLPQFLLLASLLQKLPNIAVLGTPEQWAFYDRVLKPLVGVELAQINRVDVKPNELILVDQLFMPITETQAAAVLRSDWLVVVARRPGSRRVLDKFEELLEEVKKVFGQEKVRTFDGSLPILEAERMAVSKAASSTATETACYCSFPPPFLPIPHNLSSPSLSPSPALPFSPSPYTARSLFLQARLFQAGHGAALAKMVFMPLVPFQGPSSSSIPHNPLASLPFSSPAHSLPPPPVPSRHSDSNPHSRPINRPRRPSLTIPSSDDSFPPRPSPGGGRAGGGYGAAGYGAGHGAGHGGGYGGGYGGASLGEYGYPGNNDDNVRHDANLPTPVEFSYEELVAATDGFSAVNVLGEGGYGKVYRGVVREEAPDGSTEERHVAVKQLNDEGRQGFNEWLTEVVFLRRLRHPHLVQFVGYCTDQQQALLVYELMANASLDYHLFDGSRPPLTWQQRVNVALGAAKGLAYLHEGTERQVIFRDLKAANILLDENFNAKLSDFGLAKDGPAGENTHVSTMVVGTYGYTAPEYLQTGHLTAKSDVYAFGVVLLELLCGRRAVDVGRPGDEKNLVFWAKPFLADRKRIGEIVDPRLQGRFSHKGALKLAVAAHCCLQDAKSRPSMADMVQTLTALMEMGEGAGGGSGRGVTGSDGGSSGGAVAPADGGLTAASYDAKSLHRVQVVANGGTVVPGLVETLGG
ncbi:unnamed protein product [Closterium sp. NIES-64]|nr:unnamed protein product [Closterium sp. NIES-64]